MTDTGDKRILHPVAAVLLLYLLLFLLRFIEYFYIRTDSTIIGEAVLHKAAGVVIMLAAAKRFFGSASAVGFGDKSCVKRILLGLGLGLGVFAVAYLSECLLLRAQGISVSLKWYVSTYAVDENVGYQTGFLFYLICIAGNIVNVVMEEGVFRGLFQKLLEEKYKFIASALIVSVLFGLWHFISPVRSYFDGNTSKSGMIANIIMLVLTSALVGFKFALITRLTGSLYMSMGDHFVNNTIVNVLHVLSEGGSDELMFVRITIAQTLSFALVLIYYLKHRKDRCRNDADQA